MPYGDIFAGTWRQIWRHKRLWLFGLIGYALAAIGYGAYMAVTLNWQSRWFDLMNRTMTPQGYPLPDSALTQMFGQMVWLFAGLGMLALLALIGYLINLAMRGATIHEAAAAWRGERTETGRGVSVGASRMLHLLVIDLLWWVPAALILSGTYVLGIVLLIAGIEGASGGRNEGIVALLGTFGWLGCLGCLALLIAVLYGIFAPLMYQSAVQGRHGLGAAIREGWRLARSHLGPMIIFWLLTIGVSLALGLVLALLTLPAMLPWLMSWVGTYAEMMGQAMRGVEPTLPRFGSLGPVGIALASLGYTLTIWLQGSLLQTFSLTMYAEVYRRLAPDRMPVEPGQAIV